MARSPTEKQGVLGRDSGTLSKPLALPQPCSLLHSRPHPFTHICLPNSHTQGPEAQHGWIPCGEVAENFTVLLGNTCTVKLGSHEKTNSVIVASSMA